MLEMVESTYFNSFCLSIFNSSSYFNSSGVFTKFCPQDYFIIFLNSVTFRPTNYKFSSCDTPRCRPQQKRIPCSSIIQLICQVLLHSNFGSNFNSISNILCNTFKPDIFCLNSVGFTIF